CGVGCGFTYLMKSAPDLREIENALMCRRDHPSALVREHVEWALAQGTGSRS
ncbi:MAG: hypothetical protein V4637_05065, partial [Pseudomonadota bacterium]